MGKDQRGRVCAGSAVLLALDAIDPESLMFRYPNAPDGQRHVTGRPYFDVRHPPDRVEQTAQPLEAIGCHVKARSVTPEVTGRVI
jgi:hypothetical protein